jgi:hypothetical protein
MWEEPLKGSIIFSYLILQRKGVIHQRDKMRVRGKHETC